MTDLTFERLYAVQKPPHYVSLIGEQSQRAIAHVPIGKRNIGHAKAIAERIAHLWNAGEKTEAMRAEADRVHAIVGKTYRLSCMTVKVVKIDAETVTWCETEGPKNRRQSPREQFERYAVEI